MKMKTLLAALALAAGLAPALALAQGCSHERQAQISCAEGQSWDAATRSCVTVGS
ncbi:adenylosuccinate lyase [Defluviimonas sp. SAOS-178_SWC]|uniref:adenylosuccinate lyase n=1 Tax=Defluviimonas sp. SAOS-178_SWC TaxID=3121287 RepID=UPI0032217042